MPGQQKIPGPDHPITIEKNPARVTVRVGGRVLADTTSALVLREANYPPVQYVPLADVDRSMLRSTDTTTYCPFKGDAAYFSVSTPDAELTDVIWTYPAPYEAVAPIAEHVAFYQDRVEITVSEAA